MMSTKTNRHRRALRGLGSLLAGATLASCAVGPDFKTPEAPTTDRYTGQPLAEKTVATDLPGGEAQVFLSGRELPDRWWTLFGSPKLDALVQEALQASPTIASAQAALRVAQENLRAQQAPLFPYFDGSFNASRQKIDTGSFGNPGGGGVVYNLYNASVGVTYNLDIWGGVRRGVEASRATAEATAWQLEATYQSLIANVITSAVLEAQQRALIIGQESIVADQQRQLKVVNAQFESGAIGRADVLLAQSNLATERGRLPAQRLALTQAQNQLAVYLGKLPSEHIASDFDLTELKLPQDVPLSLPSNLVRQRPDVRAAEAQLHQASANIGVATANLLPQIGLNASFGTQASVLDQLFAGNIYSIAGAFTQPLFHGGELTAKRRAAIATFEQVGADYRQTVLVAFQNVADTLRALETDAEALEAQFAAANASQGSLKLAELQYKLGATSFLSLLNAQQLYTQARTDYVIALGTRLRDTAALFQALGGGWTQRERTANGPADGAALASPISDTH